jgi:hypothetical protein
MTKPTNDAVGTIVVPVQDFYLWLQTYYLKPTPGTFVTWGKVKVKGANAEELQVNYSTSTTDQPEPPPEAATQPVLP